MDINPDQITAIIQAAPGLAKSGAELIGALKLTDIAKAILGDATAEFAERIRDEVRLYRFGNQLKLLKKAEKMVQDAGFPPKAVPIKLLFPLLEGASLEEDDNLHTMWAALLANAASPNEKNVQVSFITILKQMSSEEAKLLDWLQSHDEPTIDMLHTSIVHDYMKVIGVLPKGGNGRRIQECFDALESYQVIRRVYFQIASTDPLPSHPTMTDRGRAFLEACRPPKPTHNG